jgi:hypothetical protein
MIVWCNLVKRAAATVLCAGSIMATVLAAPAETSAPQTFVDGIYKQYLAKDSKGVSLASDTEIRRYFTGPLADAMAKDFADAQKAGDAPMLNGDPFIDAQDWEISNLRTAVKQMGADMALASVDFTIFMKKRSMKLHLRNTTAGWRIEEIRGPSGSLRALYKLK